MRRVGWQRRTGGILALLVFGCWLAAAWTANAIVAPRAQAQEMAEDPPPSEEEETGPTTPPASEPTPDSPKVDPSTDETGDSAMAGQPPTKKKLSMLRWTFDALGWTYTIAFLAISFMFVALLVMNLLGVRRDAIVPQELVENFEALLNEKRYQDAYDLARNDESFLGQVLSAGLARLKRGYPQAIEAMQEVGEEENMKLEHRLSYIALIGTTSPMVGLLGTVDGMIRSFSVIAESSTQPKPAQLAEGISTALFTTLVGLVLAIPALAIYNILRNRVARLALEVGIVSEGLMSRFQTGNSDKE